MAQTTASADQLVVTGRTGERADRVVFGEHGTTAITVTRTAGGAVLHVSTDGSAPTSRGPWRWSLGAGHTSLTVPVPPGEVAVVRVHAAAPVEYTVQAF